MVDDEEKISEYNEAVFQIMRLHQSWMIFEARRDSGDLKGALYKLDGIEVELSEDIRRLKKDYQSILNKINTKISTALEKGEKEREIYNLIIEKAKFLKKVQNDAGKGAKYKPKEDAF
jgi:hypothetical protein